MIQRRRNQHGFTLLEILVVISIIGILIAMGAAAFSVAQKRGRDAKRRADIQAWQKAFELYYASNNGIYGSATVNTCAHMRNITSFSGGEPKDPKTGTAYSCVADDDQYCVCAQLENTTAGNATANVSGTPTCTFGTGSSWFCATALQ